MLFGNIIFLVYCCYISVTLGMSIFTKASQSNAPTGLSSIIDAHVHIWGTGEAHFPYAIGAPLPPAGMQASSDAAALLHQLDCTGVAGALIVQPIHYMFDHSYVAQVIACNPRLKGMALMDPLAGPQFLESIKQQGFVGVRFNPSLWPKQQQKERERENEKEQEKLELMSAVRGARLFAQCGALGLPVGFMCFKGLSKHAEDIRSLLRLHPTTRVIIDHWGFFLQNGVVDEDSWAALLDLAAFPQVHVKVSAAFRNILPGEDPACALKNRFHQLVESFTPSRLLWGSDWPYVSSVSAAPPAPAPAPVPAPAGLSSSNGRFSSSSSSTAYAEAAALVTELGWGWLGEKDMKRVLHGTAEDLFGPWPSC